MSDDTIVWISGATEGIGKGLADNVPWPDARVINLSRRQHPELETVTFDLARPERSGADKAHLTAKNVPQLRQFIHGCRAQQASHSGHAWIVFACLHSTMRDLCVWNH